MQEFRDYFADLGLTEGTVDVYVRDIQIALQSGGILARLKDAELAPKTLRHVLAAARHWADFTEDPKLGKALKRLRLPPARRKGIRVPIEKPDLLQLLEKLQEEELPSGIRPTIGLMAMRGLRIGDILRMEKAQVLEALSSGQLVFQAKGRKFLTYKVLATFRPFLQMLANQTAKWNAVQDLISPAAAPGKLRHRAAARAVARALTKLGVRCGIWGIYPHRLRRTYAVEYVRQLKGDPEALVKLQQHQQWASLNTALEYVDHARGDELDDPAEQIFAPKR